jgi:hypothetical protein
VACFFFYAALRALVCKEIWRHRWVLDSPRTRKRLGFPTRVFSRYSPFFGLIRCFLLGTLSGFLRVHGCSDPGRLKPFSGLSRFWS